MSGIGGIAGAVGALTDAARERPGVGIAERAGIPDERGLPGVVAIVVIDVDVQALDEFQLCPDPDLRVARFQVASEEKARKLDVACLQQLSCNEVAREVV